MTLHRASPAVRNTMKAAAALGHMTLPTPSGQGSFHITGPAGADPRFLASHVQTVAARHADMAKNLVSQGILHPNDVDQWHAHSMAPVLNHLGIGVHAVQAGEPAISGSHYKALPPSVHPATGSFGKVAEGLPVDPAAGGMAAPCGMGPWTIISTDGNPVTVEHKFEYGNGCMGFIGIDDGCYQIWVGDGNNRYSPTSHIFPEAHAALSGMPDQCGMIAPMEGDEGLHGVPSALTMGDPATPGPSTGGIPQAAIMAAGAEEKIPGGPGAGVPDAAVPQDALAKGTKIEAMEHTDGESPKDLAVGKEIAKDHLVAKGEEAEKEYAGEGEDAPASKKPKGKKPAIAPMEKDEPADDKPAKKASALIAPMV